MAIKVVEAMPEPKVNERMEALKSDIREIIEKRIPICEIVDAPYPQSTMRERLRKAIRIVIWEYARKEELAHSPGGDKLFQIESRKIEKEVHWYVKFDAAEWDRQLQEIRKQGKVAWK